MPNMLDSYGDVTNDVTVPAIESASKTKSKKLRVFSKKDLKAIRALTKSLRKHNKRNKQMEQEAMQRKAEEEAATKAAEESAKKVTTRGTENNQSNNGAKGFLCKLGDAICNAVPKVLTTLVTMAFGFFVKTKFTGKAPQAVWSQGWY